MSGLCPSGRWTAGIWALILLHLALQYQRKKGFCSKSAPYWLFKVLRPFGRGSSSLIFNQLTVSTTIAAAASPRSWRRRRRRRFIRPRIGPRNRRRSYSGTTFTTTPIEQNWEEFQRWRLGLGVDDALEMCDGSKLALNFVPHNISFYIESTVFQSKSRLYFFCLICIDIIWSIFVPMTACTHFLIRCNMLDPHLYNGRQVEFRKKYYPETRASFPYPTNDVIIYQNSLYFITKNEKKNAFLTVN